MCLKKNTQSYCAVCSVVDSNVVAGILCRLDNTAEDRSPPGPGEVKDHIIRVGNEWSVVGVELARLVRRTSPLPAWTHESRVC